LASWRFGIPLYILGTIGLLLASDIGSGIAVYRYLIPSDLTLLHVKVDRLLTASVFTSIHELYKTGSKALALFLCLTSVSWPYVKLLLSLYAWIVPFQARAARRREKLLQVLDAFGKWSFVDICVFSIIVVIFRSSINLIPGSAVGPFVEVYVVPKWGIFGFACATAMSLVRTTRF
jgi:hypothetical protein